MRPRTDERAISLLRARVPQFEPCYLDLREIYAEDLTPSVVFTELADYVEQLLDEDEDLELIERCFAAVEEIAKAEGVDAVEVVGYSFIDSLRPDLLERSIEYLGPATERILESLGCGLCELSGEPLSPEDLADLEDLVERGYLSSPPAT